jgi:hypothetical protein
MAGVIQVGDLIKFTELALQIWNYGWASENNAGQCNTISSPVFTLLSGPCSQASTGKDEPATRGFPTFLFRVSR